MKFKTNKNNILAELQLFQGIVEKRSTMPILANILMSARDNEVEIVGTDLEVGLKTHFPAEVEEPGSLTVSGKKIFEIVRSLGEGKEILFKEDQDLKLVITSGDSEFKVLCLPEDDYPQTPEPKFKRKINLPLKTVGEMIDRVYFAITQEQRYYLNGALMVLNGNTMELVSTDGHRLAHTAAALEKFNIDEKITGIISKKTLGELRKFEDESIEFDLDENNLFFKVKNHILISRIMEGKFPNYEAVIPHDNPNILVMSREEITDVIRRVSLLSAERSKGIKFILEKNELQLFSSNPEIGEARDKLVVDYSGESIQVGFNSQYLIDFLTTAKSEKVRFELRDENSAILIRPEQEEEIKNIYVLMPMKI